MPSGIYEIFNKVSGKRYVGSASDIAKRWHAHRKKLYLGTHHSPKLQNSWGKHGADKFEFTILEVVHDKSKLTEREQFWIDHFEAASTGYNVNPIAESSRGVPRGPRSEEVKRKISEAQKGRKLKPEHIEALKAAHVGMTGKKQSEYFKRRMSEVHKGKVISEEQRAKISATRNETERKRRDSYQYPNPFKN